MSNLTESDSVTPSRSRRGKTDIAWNHVKVIDDNLLQCLYCDKIVKGGGINRMKHHLAQVKGKGIDICTYVPPHISFSMIQNLENFAYEKKGKKQKTCSHGERSQLPTHFKISQLEENEIQEIERGDGDKNKGIAINEGGRKDIKNFFSPRTTKGVQPTDKCAMASEDAIEAAHMAVCRWLYYACIPFSAVNSSYFQKMFDAIASVGPGYKAPSFHDVRGYFLKRNVVEIHSTLESFKSVWKDYGCTLMANGWTDGRGRTLINFLVYSKKGTSFLKSVDASAYLKTKEMFQLFKEVVEEIGPENVVQIMTDNATNYSSACKLITTHFKTIYWTPCAAHCIDLMLKDISKMERVKSVIDRARSLTTFIYNHVFVSTLMRKHTDGNEIIRPAITRFATHFLALQSILKNKGGLQAMVVSKEWRDSKWATKEQRGKDMTKLILSSSFWSECEVVVAAFEPLVKVLCMVDSDDKPAMGYIYQAMHKAKEAIRKTLNKRMTNDSITTLSSSRMLTEAIPYLNIIDTHWDHQLHCPLYAVGHWLNPSWFYNNINVDRVLSGVFDCIETLYYNDIAMQKLITEELKFYKEASGDFGRKLAINDRDKMIPGDWWMNYGGSTPNLQKMAVRILSQTCTSSGCERNWSVFECIHTKRRNRLEHQRLNDLVYVHYNLRLLERNLKKKICFDPISLEDIDVLEDWIVESEPPVLNEEELQIWERMAQPTSVMTQFEETNLVNLTERNDGDEMENLASLHHQDEYKDVSLGDHDVFGI